ncbi:katanin p80 WD40 repeat-containing subunit B1 homolog isoform X2 [Arabidopsis lyrata subsp. lyrata]|uniref:katanin p80 WD40 repeat-containing subunit B1 homolog isoform X2 n=1 Tax=Arabidopsis lyrata subsp. lyrata TaxID=81972 RepID=UPI000A29AD69|nr:katanin p80 WD40 repeat-containing subunit B1 homolog isoform X2 [Arabidopsis lyrata subsp. lyrata]|eukprot:XP_020890031.1 katanin p80 WD40 repeat-containing subunit B1 homolog isoform X2 [Arabidopsis lyrata subsp. lyrata]
MAKRGYKLQEFLAHSANVNCLSIGKKTSRLFITGGDDYKVNLWAIGKPTSLMSLCGHTSAVDSVAFDSAEVLVLAGASSGVIKLWDVEEAKMVRAFTGHRSNCSAVEFHPFGEFLASGSNDANLKIWDIRKKGCIQTYKGHTRGINTIRFTPDGRWVVSGGLDNVVKVWDLTAGKLLHEFKFHEGPIRSLEFHPLEFLLATGSADRTVKFWDLETFELIGSTRPEATGVRSIKFHPDGRTLFCGLDDSLKVYSWEPVVCHDGVDMGWSTLGDLCISEGKLLGCSYYQNSVGIWVSDISQIEPYGIGSADKKECVEKILSALDDQSSDKIRSSPRRSSSPDYETKEIKNIYIDCGNSAVAHKSGSLSTTKVKATSTGQAGDNKSLVVHSVVPRDSDIGKDSSDSGKESITFSKTKPGMLLRPAHVRKTPTKFDETKKQSVAVQSGYLKKSGLDGETELDTETAFDSEMSGRKPYDADDSIIKSITNKFEQALLPESPTDEAKCMSLKPPRVQRSPSTKYNDASWATSVDSEALDSKKSGLESSRDMDLPTGHKDDRGSNLCEEDIDNKSISSRSERVLSPEKPGDELKSLESPGGRKESNSVKVVRGVKVVSGRTRSLVERFERGEKITPSEDKAASATIVQSTNAVEEEPLTASVQAVSTTPTQVMPVKLDQATNSTTVEAPVLSTRRTRSTPVRVMPVVLGRDTSMATDTPPGTSTRPYRTSATNLTSDVSGVTSTRQTRISPAPVMPMILNQTTKMKSDEPPVTSTQPHRPSATNLTSDESPVTSTRPDRPSATNLTSDESPVTSTRQAKTSPAPVMPVILSQRQTTNMKSDEPVISTRPLRTSSARVMPVILNQASNTYDERPLSSSRSARTSPARVLPMQLNQADNMPSYEPPVALTRSARNSPARVIPVKLNQAISVTSDASHIRSKQRFSPTQTLATPAVLDQVTDLTLDKTYITQTQQASDILTQKEEPQISGRENDGDIWETLMQTHNEVLNTLQSRLTKLQIVRHFWERSDIKGAIMALRKLSDHSVQADVISILTDKTEILTLDLFSQLAPVLTGLLGSRTERPVNVSLEMLLKLVAVFGTVIQSTVSARRVVGVDLHAEERLQICQSCSAELQKVHKILPLLTRRGGLIARKAQELNLVLQTP